MSSRIVRAGSVAASALALIGSLASAQEAKSNAAGDSSEQLRSASQQMLQAAQAGDKETFSGFLADDLSWVGMNGQVMDKEQTLANALPPPVRSIEVQQVLPSGQAATMVAIAHMKDGTDRRMLQEWVNRDGKWKVVAHQSTAIGAAPAPTTGTAGRSAAASASAPRTVAPTLRSSTERAIWQAQADIVEAYGKGDTARYSKLTADSFTRIDTDGQVYDRSQWLDRVEKNREHPMKAGAISDVQIKLDDSSKVAWVTLQLVPFNADGSPGVPERQTRIFALNNGQWQQAASVGTPSTGQ